MLVAFGFVYDLSDGHLVVKGLVILLFECIVWENVVFMFCDVFLVHSGNSLIHNENMPM